MKKAIIFIIIALAAAEGAFAQQIFRSTYFLEGYNHRHQFNPAFASTWESAHFSTLSTES